MHCSQYDIKILKDYLYFYYAAMFSQDISSSFIVDSLILAVQSNNSILKIFKVKLADGACCYFVGLGLPQFEKYHIITIIIINRMGLSRPSMRDCFQYIMKTQICENIYATLVRISDHCTVHYHDLSINEKRRFLMKGRDHVQILKTLIRNYKRTKPI